MGHLSCPALQQAICALAVVASSAIQLTHADAASETTSITAVAMVSRRMTGIDCPCGLATLSNRGMARDLSCAKHIHPAFWSEQRRPVHAVWLTARAGQAACASPPRQSPPSLDRGGG